jgi:2-iminobutanoate/2-iminopropanoate deaminase
LVKDYAHKEQFCLKIKEIQNPEVNMKKIVVSEKAPKAIGPYSVAVQTGQLVYTAGQIGLNPETGEIVPGGVEAETRQVLTNLKNVLESAGSSLGDVVKTTVFLRDMADFSKMNAIYGEFFAQNPPARSTVAVAGLPKGCSVEIEAVAALREYA